MKLRLITVMCWMLALAGCGVEIAGTAAVVGKMQADQASQAKQSLDSVKADLEAAGQQAQERLQQAEVTNGEAK